MSDKLFTLFIIVMIILNLAGVTVRQYRIIKFPSEEILWAAYFFEFIHLSIALCAIAILKWKKTAVYIFFCITSLAVATDLLLKYFYPEHRISTPDIILAIAESLVLLIIVKPIWKYMK